VLALYLSYYADRRFNLSRHIDAVRDSRPRPQIPCGTIVRDALVMHLGRLGSLNALEQLKPAGFCKQWIGAAHPSADRIGDVAELIEPDDLRSTIEAIVKSPTGPR